MTSGRGHHRSGNDLAKRSAATEAHGSAKDSARQVVPTTRDRPRLDPAIAPPAAGVAAQFSSVALPRSPPCTNSRTFDLRPTDCDVAQVSQVRSYVRADRPTWHPALRSGSAQLHVAGSHYLATEPRWRRSKIGIPGSWPGFPNRPQGLKFVQISNCPDFQWTDFHIWCHPKRVLDRRKTAKIDFGPILPDLLRLALSHRSMLATRRERDA